MWQGKQAYMQIAAPSDIPSCTCFACEFDQTSFMKLYILYSIPHETHKLNLKVESCPQKWILYCM